MFPVDKKLEDEKKLDDTNVLIPWSTISYLTIASSGFGGGGAYGSLPDAAIWWCLRTGDGGVLTSGYYAKTDVKADIGENMRVLGGRRPAPRQPVETPRVRL